MTHDTAAYMTVKSAPPATVVVADMVGMQVPEIVQWLTLIYLVMLVGHKGWQIYKEFRSGRSDNVSTD